MLRNWACTSSTLISSVLAMIAAALAGSCCMKASPSIVPRISPSTRCGFLRIVLCLNTSTSVIIPLASREDRSTWYSLPPPNLRITETLGSYVTPASAAPVAMIATTPSGVEFTGLMSFSDSPAFASM